MARSAAHAHRRGRLTAAAPLAAHEAQAARSRTFESYAAEWISTRTTASGDALRPRTREEYERLVETALAPLAPLPLTSITPAAVRQWFTALTSSGRKTTAARAYGLARSIMTTAVRDGLIASNPVEVRGGQNASTGRKVEPPTDAELAIIEAVLSDRAPQLQAALLIAAWGGLRFGELTALCRRDLVRDADFYRVRIARAVTRTSTGYVVGTPKSAAGVRDVALPPTLTPIIEAHLATFADLGADGLLFPSKAGGHMGQPELSRSGWHAARAAAGRDDLPWHGLRHYGLTKFAQAGATTKELLDRAGHTTLGVALVYQHAAADRAAELARRMTGE